MPKILSSLSSVSHQFDAIICDLWGVLHDGHVAHSGAVSAIQRFAEKGGRTIVLSNAPRSKEAVIEFMEKVGVQHDIFDDVISSGHLLLNYLKQHHKNQTYYHIGSKRDRSLLQMIEQQETNNPLSSDFIICTGLEKGEMQELESLKPVLGKLASPDRSLICVNPDRIVHVGDFLMICAGAIADLYSTLGGPVTWIGKPYAIAYDHCRHVLKTENVLVIGDGLHTDIEGAQRQGFKSLFIYSGIHRDKFKSDKEASEASYYERDPVPDFVMRTLR